MFNLKNKACQEVFKDATTAANNNKYLSSVFDEEGDVNKLTEKFLRRLNKTINKCFRKIRIKDQEKVDNVKEDLFNKWRELKKKSDAKSKAELEEVENELAEKYAKENYDKIKEKTGDFDCDVGGMSSGRLWNLKKEMFPKSREPPTAMKDPITGNLLTTSDKINDAAVNVYTDRLRNRPMKEHLKHIKVSK